jgi:hypothetical protein
MIEYRVVAVPERAERAQALAARVGAQIVLDEHGAGTFKNHQRALASAAAGTHVVILEDDAVVCEDFTAHVARLIEARPTHLLGLYVGREFPPRHQSLIRGLVRGRPAWLDDPKLTEALRWAVGYVMPVADIPAVLAQLRAGSQQRWLDTDKRVGAWHAAHGRLSYPFPSPVDHDDDVPSTLSRARHGRVAWAHCEGVEQ